MRLGLAVVVLAPLAACAAFGAASVATGSASPGADAGAPDAPDAPAGNDAGAVPDAGADSGANCDHFDRADLVTPGSLWEDAGGDPLPAIQSGALLVQTPQGSTTFGFVESPVRPRGDTITVSATVTIDQANFHGFTGRLRVFNIDASPNVTGEYVALDITDNWNVVYRNYASGDQTAIVGGPVVEPGPHKIALTTRFDPTQGMFTLSIDDAPVLSQSGLATAPAVPQTDWRLILGLEPHDPDTTPLGEAHYDDVCVSP